MDQATSGMQRQSAATALRVDLFSF